MAKNLSKTPKGSLGELLRTYMEKDPAATSTISTLINYPGVHAIGFHRVAHFFYKKRRFFWSRFVSQVGRFLTGIEIHPGAQIGKNLFLSFR